MNALMTLPLKIFYYRVARIGSTHKFYALLHYFVRNLVIENSSNFLEMQGKFVHGWDINYAESNAQKITARIRWLR